MSFWSTSQTGSNIIPKGDPSNPNASMQYVKTGLDGLVAAEIESKLLQSATLKLEYTITIVNNSDKDYLEADYYYYGRNGITETTSKVKLVVDYLDSTMVLDETQNNANWELRTADAVSRFLPHQCGLSIGKNQPERTLPQEITPDSTWSWVLFFRVFSAPARPTLPTAAK